MRDPYFVVPGGDVGQQAFAAIRKEGVVELGTVVFTSLEHVIALEPWDHGIVGVTLRYPYEVRNLAEYFEGIKDETVLKDMLDLAVHIVASKRGEFDPQKFENHYENALEELLRKKQSGEKIERAKEPSRTNVVNLMGALRQTFRWRAVLHSRHESQRRRVRSALTGNARCCCRYPARRKRRVPLKLRSGRRGVKGRLHSSYRSGECRGSVFLQQPKLRSCGHNVTRLSVDVGRTVGPLFHK